MAAHITLSAFADEISPDPVEQFNLLTEHGVIHVELRSAWKTNVLDLSDEQVTTIEGLLRERGMKLSAIGSPIGKIKISDPFEPHLQRFERALHLAERFQVKNIRVFSYYPSEEGKPWADVRAEVLRRMEIKVARAEKRGLRLVHENEARIYGEDPIRVLDLLRSLASPAFQAAYDAGNYVHGGYDPIQAWNMTREYTVHLHIKDWMPGGEKGVLPGTGAGRIPESIALAKEQNYSGFATLEPHLLGGGPTGGITGPELFPQAIAAFRAILDQAGYEHS